MLLNNNLALSRVFTRYTLNELCIDNPSLVQSVVKRYNIKTDGNTTYEEVISEVYCYLNKHYRNEYFYKNTLLNKLIIDVHRVKTTTALTEVPVAKSKADVIMINGKAIVYEIKTALDTLERLQTQLNDYYKAFDHVCVVVDETRLPVISSLFSNSPVGIYVLTKRGTIHREKEPETNKDLLDKSVMFKVLNKPEYEIILQKCIGRLPNVTPVHYYKECKRLFCDLSVETAYEEFINALKKRSRIETIDFSIIPYALRFLVYFSGYDVQDIQRLAAFLREYYTEDQ